MTNWKDIKLKDNTPKIDEELRELVLELISQYLLAERRNSPKEADEVMSVFIEEIKQLFNPNNVRK